MYVIITHTCSANDYIYIFKSLYLHGTYIFSFDMLIFAKVRRKKSFFAIVFVLFTAISSLILVYLTMKNAHKPLHLQSIFFFHHPITIISLLSFTSKVNPRQTRNQQCARLRAHHPHHSVAGMQSNRTWRECRPQHPIQMYI